MAAHSFLVRWSLAAINVLQKFPHSLIALVSRIFPAIVFWQSGQTKVTDWQVNDSAIELFRYEYKLPLIDPVIAAYAATFAEHFFPLLLIIGLATRFAALSLLIVTLIIEVFVYPDAWLIHGLWAIPLLYILTRGPGLLSLDAVIKKSIAQH